MGFGDAAATTAIFSIIGVEYTEDRDLYFGYFEAAVGCGLMLGPVIGQTLYIFFGFSGMFFSTGLMITLAMIA